VRRRWPPLQQSAYVFSASGGAAAVTLKEIAHSAIPHGAVGTRFRPIHANVTLVPSLKVRPNTGYFDLATPFFEGVAETPHVPIPAILQKNH